MAGTWSARLRRTHGSDSAPRSADGAAASTDGGVLDSGDLAETVSMVSGDPAPEVTGAVLGRSPMSRRLQQGVIESARWTVRLLIIGLGLWVLFQILGEFWSVLLPILFGLLLATVLWPPVRFLRRKLPPALAALIAVVGLLAVVGGLIAEPGAHLNDEPCGAPPQAEPDPRTIGDEAPDGADCLERGAALHLDRAGYSTLVAGRITIRRFGSTPTLWVRTLAFSTRAMWTMRRSIAGIGSSWMILPV